MEFEWDEGKDAENRAKHGVSLGDAVRLDWDRAFNWPDQRQDYGETRTIALVPFGPRLYLCVYTLRQSVFRVISLRKANAREVRQYEHSYR